MDGFSFPAELSKHYYEDFHSRDYASVSMLIQRVFFLLRLRDGNTTNPEGAWRFSILAKDF